MTTVNRTPLMQQYQSIKKTYPDDIVLFQMGDFYESFFGDAEFVAKQLDIILTYRDKKKKTPLAGFPLKALKIYLPKLVKTGKKIIIAEQVESATDAKGLVKRKVTQIITPGTTTLSEVLDATDHNYLACLYCSKNYFEKSYHSLGLAFVDISTGDFYTTEFVEVSAHQLNNYLHLINPVEILVPDQIDFSKIPHQFLKQPLMKDHFNLHSAKKILTKHFSVINLDGFGLRYQENATIACGTIMQYILENQQTSPQHIKVIKQWTPHHHMLIDRMTINNLQVMPNLSNVKTSPSLLSIMDNTKTPMGSRLLKKWLLAPLLKKQLIDNRHNLVKTLTTNNTLLRKILQQLNCIRDLARLTASIGLQRITPKQLLVLKQSIINSLKLLKDLPLNEALWKAKQAKIDYTNLNILQKLIEETILDSPQQEITQGGILEASYNPQILELRELAHSGNAKIKEIVEKEKVAHKINTMKVGYNKVFGYYIEVPHTHSNKVPHTFIRKQTLVNAERYITEELKILEEKILSASDKLHLLEYELFLDFRKKLLPYLTPLQDLSALVAEIDVLSTFAHNALIHSYVRPQVLEMDTHKVNLQNARHPIVEQVSDTDFVPNNMMLNRKDEGLIILTGPNMAGKSTYIRTLGLITLMSQVGSFVPADKAELSIRDRVFARVGAGDDLATGRSTFMVEMSETANIINNATGNSLIILDELGRGTSTYDGLSLAWAISKYIHKKIRALTILATHYHEMTRLSEQDPAIKNYTVEVAEENGQVRFLYNIVVGKANKSYGIHVGKLAGLPTDLIMEAQQILDLLEKQKQATVSKQKNLFSLITSPKNTLSPTHPPASAKLIRYEKWQKLLAKIEPNSITPLQALELVMKLKEKTL